MSKDRETRHPAPNVVDQRQQQIDPAGHHHVDPNKRPATNTKQPGNLPVLSDAEIKENYRRNPTTKR
ncbi:hypothetical protein [Cypionkella sinensis]|uniref:Uncharacterized protein n=1 Tax=Cypionkella sinensis TaxID=1756043 RepID=A0ABV7IT46_9RHOB